MNIYIDMYIHVRVWILRHSSTSWGKVESNVDSFLVFIQDLLGRVLDMSTQHTATRCNTHNTVHHFVSHKTRVVGFYGLWIRGSRVTYA